VNEYSQLQSVQSTISEEQSYMQTVIAMMADTTA
jgi:hypothetical protein